MVLEVISETNIEQIRIINVAARGAFKFAVDAGLHAQTELSTEPSTRSSLMFCRKLAKL